MARELVFYRPYIGLLLNLRFPFFPLTGRQPGNNKMLAFFGTEYEAFQRENVTGGFFVCCPKLVGILFLVAPATICGAV